ncbi:MAG: hypothetical protein WCV56_03195 [Candidatus Omnitrophota bacterium]
MSIIADALKKAQEERVLEKIFSSGSPSVKPGFTGQKPSRLTVAVIFLFLLSTIVFVSYLVFFRPGNSGQKSVIPPASPLGRTNAKTVETTAIPEQTITQGSPVATAMETASPENIEPVAELTAGPKLPVLSGIMHSPKHPRAVIDGILSSQGDQVGNFRILSIFPDRVIISSSGKEYELILR